MAGSRPDEPDEPDRPDRSGAGSAATTVVAALTAAVATVVVIANGLAGGPASGAALLVAGGAGVLVLAVRVFMLARQNGTILGIWRESSRSLRELASRTSDVVLVCDLDGIIGYASPAVARLRLRPRRPVRAAACWTSSTPRTARPCSPRAGAPSARAWPRPQAGRAASRPGMPPAAATAAAGRGRGRAVPGPGARR